MNIVSKYILHPSTIMIAFAACLALPVSGMAAEFTDVESRSLPTAGIETLKAEVIVGDFMVTPHGKNEVTLTIHRKVKGVSEEESVKVLEALKTTFEVNGKTIHLKADHPKNKKEWKKATGLSEPQYEFQYELSMPAGINLNLATVSGDMTINGMTGDTNLSTVQGDIAVAGTGSKIRANSVEGDIVISDASDLHANSVSGDIAVELVNQPGDACRLNAVSGDIAVSVNKDLALTVQVQTMSGDIEVDLPLDQTKSTSRQLMGTMNGGGAAIKINTVSGDIKVE